MELDKIPSRKESKIEFGSEDRTVSYADVISSIQELPLSINDSILRESLKGDFASFSQQLENQLVEGIASFTRMKEAIINKRLVFSKDVNGVYQQFIEATKLIMKNEEKKLSIEIMGSSSQDYRSRPSLDKWIELNPGRWAVIKFMEMNLIKKGWKPSIQLSPYSYDNEDGTYFGGYSVIFTCSFKE